MPMIAEIVVVLPMPLRPSSVTTSPARIASSTPNSTRPSPYPASSPLTSSIRPFPLRRDRRGAPPGRRGSPSGGPRRDDASIDQDRDAVGQREDRIHVVLDEDDREPSLEAGRAGRRISAELGHPHPGHRLVEQQQARPARQDHRQFERPPLAVRQCGGRHVGSAGEPDFFQRGMRRLAQPPVAGSRAPEAEAVPLMRLHRQRDIVERREFAKQRRDLKRARDAERRSSVRGEARDVASGEMNRAGIRAQSAGQAETSVVLPAPFGPMTAWISPGMTVSVTSASASSPPNRLVSPRRREQLSHRGPGRSPGPFRAGRAVPISNPAR